MAKQNPLFIAINRRVKQQFGSRPGFVSVKSGVVGSFPYVRAEGDLPLSLVCEIATFIEQDFPEFVRWVATTPMKVFSFHSGGSLINWYAR